MKEIDEFPAPLKEIFDLSLELSMNIKADLEEDMAPFAYISTGGTKLILGFQMEDFSNCVSIFETTIKEREKVPEYIVFAYDGFVTANSIKSDAILFNVYGQDEPEVYLIAQTYRPKSSGFEVTGKPFIYNTEENRINFKGNPDAKPIQRFRSSLELFFKTAKPISYAQVLERLDGVKVKNNADKRTLKDSLSKNNFFYVPGKSTRGVSILNEGEKFKISLLAFSSNEDFGLFLDLIKLFYELTESGVIWEDGTTVFSDEQLRTFYSKYDQWIINEKRNTVQSVRDNISNTMTTIRVPGINRFFHIGINVLSWLIEYRHDDEKFYDQMINIMLKTQYIDESIYRVPSILSYREKDTDAMKYNVNVMPGTGNFIPAVDTVTLEIYGSSYVVLFERLKLLNHFKFRFIDEEQLLLERLSEEELAGIAGDLGLTVSRQVKEEKLLKKLKNYFKKG